MEWETHATHLPPTPRWAITNRQSHASDYTDDDEKRMKLDAADRKAVKLKKHNKPMKPQPEELFKFNGHIAADDSLAIVHQFFADLPYDQNQNWHWWEWKLRIRVKVAEVGIYNMDYDSLWQSVKSVLVDKKLYSQHRILVLR